MVDWSSHTELILDFEIFDKLCHALLGLYIWEILTTMDFEWEFIMGKKNFRWPMVFYFLNRYIQLCALVGSMIALDSTTQLNCRALYRFILFCGFGAVSFSSINLAIRTIALWSHNMIIIAAVSLASSVQWILNILIIKEMNAIWVGPGSCVVSRGEHLQAAFFVYTMCFNLGVLCLTTVKLVQMSNNANSSHLLGQNKLTHLIFADGLIFFIIALLADILVVVFVQLNLNAAMNTMFQVPSSIISTIVACRSVRRLMNFNQSNGGIGYNNNTTGSSSNNRNPTTRNVRGIQSVIQTKPGVHVQMETFTHIEDEFEKAEGAESITGTGDIESQSQNKGQSL